MKSIKTIRSGQEIFNDYGELPRADLLRRYGYVTENYAQYDVVELPLDTICEVAGMKGADMQHGQRQVAIFRRGHDDGQP
jgi:SET domain-containing protein 6